MRKRILIGAASAVFAVLTVGAVALQAGSASAAPRVAAAVTTDFGPGTVRGALVRIDASNPRGDYIDANGLPHCLPEGPNNTFRAIGDYPLMWFSGHNPDCQFGPSASGLTSTQIQALIDAAVTKAGPGSVKKDVAVNVTVDFDKTKPVVVTGLPAFKAGNPELWGSNAGEIPDAAANIIVRRVNTSVTTCPATVPFLDAAPSVGSLERKFCVYPFHLTPTPPALVPGFLAGQKFDLDIWVFAP